MTSRSEGRGEGVSNFVTECDRRGGGGKCQCDVTLRYTCHQFLQYFIICITNTAILASLCTLGASGSD